MHNLCAGEQDKRTDDKAGANTPGQGIHGQAPHGHNKIY